MDLSHPHQFNVLSLNVKSLYAKFDQFVAFLEIARQQNIRIHDICIQQSWLGRMSDLSLAQIDGYNCFYRDKRPECSNHGGLITYVDDNFEANDLLSDMSHRFGKIYLHKSNELVTQEI